MNFKYLGILIIAFFCLFPVLLLQMIHHRKVRESRGQPRLWTLVGWIQWCEIEG